MTEREEQNFLPSIEVVGRYSYSQQQEYSFLGAQIMEAEGWKLDDPDDVEKAKSVMDDTLNRGLKMTGKQWFTPTESILQAFDSGLSQREEVLRRIKQVHETGKGNQFLTTSENDQLINYLNIVSPLDPNLSEVENLADLAKNRELTVKNLRKVFFEESDLSAGAAKLRTSETARDQETFNQGLGPNFEIEDRIYRNLLFNLVVYPGTPPSLIVEPKDVPLLVELWSDKQVREQGISRVTEGIKAFAQRLGLDATAVQIYTINMFKYLLTFTEGEVDLDFLKNSHLLAFRPQDIEAEENEFVQRSSDRQVILVNPETYQIAETKYIEAKRLNTIWEEVVNKSDDEYSEELATRKAGTLINYLKTFNAFDLVFTLSKIQEEIEQIEESFKEIIYGQIPINTYVDALEYAYARVIRDQQTGNNIISLDTPSGQVIRSVIAERVEDELREKKIGLAGIVNKIPLSFLGDITINMQLPSDQQTALIQMDTSRWIQLLTNVGVRYMTFQTDSGAKTEDIEFPLGSEALRQYFDNIPEEKQQQVATGLKKVIKF